MKQRITVRLNDSLSRLIKIIQGKEQFNLSALVRKGLEEEIKKIIGIDNSNEDRGLKKDEK